MTTTRPLPFALLLFAACAEDPCPRYRRELGRCAVAAGLAPAGADWSDNLCDRAPLTGRTRRSFSCVAEVLEREPCDGVIGYEQAVQGLAACPRDLPAELQGVTNGCRYPAPGVEDSTTEAGWSCTLDSTCESNLLSQRGVYDVPST
jgi:hypothetical protein